jgi:PadR family transcriptional regulator, regulatory protein PadR
MKRPARRPLAGTTKETAALLLSFCKVRVLHYASITPIHPSFVLERLRIHGCPITPATLNRVLLRMERNRWLSSKITPGTRRPAHRAYSLTPQGRDALHLARKRLNVLATLQQTNS